MEKLDSKCKNYMNLIISNELVYIILNSPVKVVIITDLGQKQRSA